jgi:hypothetical protein
MPEIEHRSRRERFRGLSAEEGAKIIQSGEALHDEPSEPAPAVETPAIAWNMDMEAAPRDGRPIWNTYDGSEGVLVSWRKTRRYDAPSCKWVEDGFWALHNTSTRVSGEPLGWEKYS